MNQHMTKIHGEMKGFKREFCDYNQNVNFHVKQGVKILHYLVDK